MNDKSTIPGKSVPFRLRNGLWCGLDSVGLRPSKRMVVLFLPEYHCTDMGGAIALARYLMPDVQQIHTMAGKVPDTLYRMLNDGDWRAYLPRSCATA